MIAGIVIGMIGINFTGTAGQLKENELSAWHQLEGFSLVKGLLLSLLAGVLSAVYRFALAAGDLIADVASAHGRGVFRGNVVYMYWHASREIPIRRLLTGIGLQPS